MFYDLPLKEKVDRQFVHGEAEAIEGVQYPAKSKVTDFFSKENEAPSAKKRRLRSPLSTLPQQKLANFPCSWSNNKTLMSPRKALMQCSPRKLEIKVSPRKLFSPTANLPNLVVDGKSPHQPTNSTKKGQKRLDLLTWFRRGQQNGSVVEEPNKKSRKRAKKSLDMSNV